MFKRSILRPFIKRMSESRKFIQVLIGPRQTGKTTISRQVIDALKIPSHYASADAPTLQSRSWIEQQWETARQKSKGAKGLLVLDEVQKIPDWSEIVKKLWDEDSASRTRLYVILLGSSPLLVQKGLTESLAGRFEVTHVTHWSYKEMHAAFGWNQDEYMYYGGYPGSAKLINDTDQHRWSNYIKESLIETSISRDILLMTRIDKPVLLRRLFELGCMYSGQVLSYQKMLGQLQDAGNTVTLAHYLSLLGAAGLLTGLQKYAGQTVRQKGSSPKFQVLNTALLSAQLHLDFKAAKSEQETWGRIVESAIGAHIANGIKGKDMELFYWAHRNCEVDFVLAKGSSIIAIEVKSGKKKANLPGIEMFSKEFNVKKKLLVGGNGMKISEFLLANPEELF